MVHKDKIRLTRGLFRDMHGAGKNTLLIDDSSKHRQREEVDAAVLEWQQLQQQGRIEKLDIQYYPFDPMLNFIIIDRRIAYIDLMKPQKVYPSATSRFAPTCYIVTDRTAEGRQLINDLVIIFEQIWNEFKEV